MRNNQNYHKNGENGMPDGKNENEIGKNARGILLRGGGSPSPQFLYKVITSVAEDRDFGPGI